MINSEIKWKQFAFTDIFIIKGGFYNKKPSFIKQGDIPFIGATEKNNGITGFTNEDIIKKCSKTGSGINEPLSKKLFEGNCICVTNNGSVGYAYYQKTKFTCSHDVNPLYLKEETLNEIIALFLIAAIEQQKVCFRYSRKWRPKRMVKSRIMLPISSDGKPYYKYMEECIRSINLDKKLCYFKYINKEMDEINYIETPQLSTKKWEDFYVKDIFKTIHRGKRLITDNQVDGIKPYVSSSSLKNGVDNFIGNTKNIRKYNNCLSLANSGSVGSAFYHPYEFIASDHVTCLKNDSYNKYIYLFISTMLSRLSGKYNFNREINDNRISREKIMLPINSKGEPDFDYMEQFTKNIIYKKVREYLEFKDIQENQ